MIILTDLSEVLIRGVIGADQYIKERYGVKVAESCVLRHRAINERFCDMLRGRLTEDQYWETFFSGHSWPFGVEEAKAALSWNLAQAIPDTLKVYQEIIAYPRSNEDKRLGMAEGMPTIYLVSDHITERLDQIKALHPGIFKVVKREFWSCELGQIKRDPGFFENLLEKEHLRPEEVIFIDDNVANIATASRLGVPGIRFQNATQLRTVLRETYGFVFAGDAEREAAARKHY
ncbi:HAD-IA family hydrolase [Candidatus Saccharibacteria bacterium]|nr:HAD-IA family hydrolase [Candidatus Saccharibacteria bacterium]MBQ6593600.1 HAD-IA family hydrolase [Candidatus Saccharibacteria bacterium]